MGSCHVGYVDVCQSSFRVFVGGVESQGSTAGYYLKVGGGEVKGDSGRLLSYREGFNSIF